MQCIARYEIMWEREVSLTEEITKAWQSDLVVQNLGNIACTLQIVMKSLKSWSHEKFGAVSKELAQIRKNIQELNEGDHAAHQTELSQLRNHLDELLYREEMMWLQRSRIS
jgi:hypothetical protein